MSDLAAFKATFIRARQVRDEVIFEFSAPAELATEYLARIGGYPKPGESRWCGIARLNPQQEGSTEESDSADSTATNRAAPTTSPEPARPTNRYTQRAGILSNDRVFQMFLNKRYGTAMNRDAAAQQIRLLCEVESRADILPNSKAAVFFDTLESSFVCWRDAPDLEDEAARVQ